MTVLAIHQHELATGILVSTPSWTRIPPPSPPCSSGLSQSTDFGSSAYAWNLHWSSILHMVIYMFQWYFWRKKWQPTPVFLPGEIHGQRSLAGYSSWDCKESDMTEQLSPTLKSSHPHLLPLSPKVCSLYICVSCAALHVGSLVPSF